MHHLWRALARCIRYGGYTFCVADTCSGSSDGDLIVHGCFVKTGIWIQIALALVKTRLMAFMVILGVVAPFLPRKSSSEDAKMLSLARLFEGSDWDLVALRAAVFKVSYSFIWHDNVNNILNKARDPIRTLKTMASTALLTIIVSYLMLNVDYFTIVPLEEINKSEELIATLFPQKIFGASVGSTVLSTLVAISAAGNVMAVIFTLVKTLQSTCACERS